MKLKDMKVGGEYLLDGNRDWLTRGTSQKATVLTLDTFTRDRYSRYSTPTEHTTSEGVTVTLPRDVKADPNGRKTHVLVSTTYGDDIPAEVELVPLNHLRGEWKAARKAQKYLHAADEAASKAEARRAENQTRFDTLDAANTTGHRVSYDPYNARVAMSLDAYEALLNGTK